MMPMPFSVSSAIALKDEPATVKILGTLGFTKAPAYLNQSTMGNDIIETYNNLYNANKSWPDKIVKQKKDEIKALLHDGKKDEAIAKEHEYVQKGILTAKQVKFLTGDTKTSPPDQWMFQRLLKEHRNDAIRLYSKMTDEDKKEYDPKGKLKKAKIVDWSDVD